MEDIKMKEFKYVVTDNEGIHARPAGLLVKVYRTAHTSLIRPAQDTVHVSGIVQKLRMIHLDHPAADGKDLLRPVHGPLQRFHIVRSHFRIVI